MAVLLLAILLAWGLTGEDKRPFDLKRAWYTLLLVIIDPMGLFALWLIHLGIGIWKAHVAVTDAGLDIYCHQFSMWSLRRLYRAKLPWNQVIGIQRFELDNMLAPGGVQREFIVYTTAGPFVVAEAFWPGWEQIAAQISGHIGKAIGDVSAVGEPITGKRPVDRRGIRLMHGIGWLVQAMGWIFAGLSLMALAGGANFQSMMAMIMMSAMLVLGGAFLRRFRMG